MIELKKLLFEGRTNSISEKEAKSVFKKNIESAWDWSNTFVFRGVDGFGGKYGFIEPSKHRRKSNIAKNYYTLILDNSENWQKFPDRSRSIVCTTDKEQATAYGTPYFVLPFDGAKLGVAPMSDIWQSFMTKEFPYFKLSNFERYLEELKKYALGMGSERELSQNSFKKLKEEITLIDKKLKGGIGNNYEDLTRKGTYGFKKFVKNYLDSPYDNLFGYIEYILDPERNGFRMYEYTKGFKLPAGEREIWTESPSLLVRVNGSVHNSLNDILN